MAPSIRTFSPSAILRRLVLARPGEGPLLAASTLYFFFLLFSYYLLRPMRETLGIARGADKLPWLMTGTMVVMFLVNPAFASLVSRVPRRRFIPAVYRVCMGCMGTFYLLFRFLPGHGGVLLGYAFYVWLSVFNLFAVSVFWAFMADGFREEQGRRLFGFIATGGTLGGILGAGTTGLLASGVRVGPVGLRVEAPSLLLLSILSLEAAVACFRYLAQRLPLERNGGGEAREPGPGILDGLRLFTRSPYLALMGVYILLYTVTSTLLYLQQGQIVARTFPAVAQRTAAFARMDLWVNLLTLFTQVFLASRIVSRVSMRFLLCIMPVLTASGFVALWAMPTFAVLAIFQVLRRGLHYAVDRPAREVLYIPLGPNEKYKAKPFIDTFVYRTGDLLGTWTPSALAAGPVPVAGIALLASAAWLGGGLWLGRLQARISGARA
jgi:AAA family ATP:ADP antiporter